MKTTNTFEFDTEAEAKAFIQGVEYANDSAITVLGIKLLGSKCVVHIHDADEED